MTPLRLPSLTLVTDRQLYRAKSEKKWDPLSVVESAIEGGVDIVQLRTRQGNEDLGLYAVAMRLREMTEGRVQFVITGDLELAEKCMADGVLLQERTYKPADARAFLRDDRAKSVGVFARSVIGASRSEMGGADYCQYGPIFDQNNVESVSALQSIRRIKDAVQIPVIAFGGVANKEQAVDCLRAGADGVAVTDAIRSAMDPRAAAREMRIALDAAWRALHGPPEPPLAPK